MRVCITVSMPGGVASLPHPQNEEGTATVDTATDAAK
jgi:hypothetical protein